MKFEFGIASHSDDESIRRLLAENPMPGSVSVAFEREPDYFLGHGVMGDRCLTAKATDAETGRLAGIMCLAESDRFVGGLVRRVGYIGQIRVDHRYRGYLMPMRAAAFVREIAGGRWPDLWISAIVDKNPGAREIFADKPRPSFPHFEPVSEIHTLGILTRPAAGNTGPVRMVPGSEVGIEAVVQFLNRRGSQREFFPSYRAADFTNDTRTPGFDAERMLVAVEGGAIVGLCGVWDQSSFKQTVVHGYRGWLQKLRPLVNAVGPIAGFKRLPGAGEKIKSAYLSFLAVTDDNPTVFFSLLRSAVGTAYEMGMDYLLAGFSITDPLLAVAGRFRHILYRSTMYAFGFDGPLEAAAFDRTKVPYLEIAAL